MGPIGAGGAAESPGIGLVFKIIEGFLHFRRKAGLHQHLVFASFQQNVEVLNINGANVFTGPAGGAGPQNVIGDGRIFSEQRLNRFIVFR
ncbi:hypothetical protein ES703_87375 [subsurface metagenome]